MPLECSHSFRNFILWVGSKSTTLNDFWKPLWCTDTQAYTFTQQSLKFFRFLCRPIQSPQHLEGKKTTWTPHTNIITSAWCHFIPTSHLSYNSNSPLCTGATSIISSASSNFRITGFRVTGFMGWGPFPALQRRIKGREMGQCSPGGVWSSTYSMVPAHWSLYIPCTKHDIRKIWSGSKWGTL